MRISAASCPSLLNTSYLWLQYLRTNVILPIFTVCNEGGWPGAIFPPSIQADGDQWSSHFASIVQASWSARNRFTNKFRRWTRKQNRYQTVESLSLQNHWRISQATQTSSIILPKVSSRIKVDKSTENAETYMKLATNFRYSTLIGNSWQSLPAFILDW